MQAHGHIWLQYLSYSGATCYVPIDQQAPADNQGSSTAPLANYGTYTFKALTNIRTHPNLKGEIVGQYLPGQKVFYNGKVVGDGYTWLYYLTPSHTTCYVAILT
ncbi:hypothetical protein EQ500_02560 [Lactobacillus sp. XV13L]|nr:hypothetical protein [Lactobacillus sp. XV13L]